MAEQMTWSVAEPQKLTFEQPVTELRVRVVGGTVNVVASDEGPARLEIAEVDGPPLHVVHEAGVLTLSYEDLPWNGSQGIKEWFESKPWKSWSGGDGRKAWERSVTVTLTVPASTSVQLAAVSATAFVSGISADIDVNGVSGDTTLVGLSGKVKVNTVSGAVEAQSVTGGLGFHSVSGGLTVVDGAGGNVRADSVSGDMLIDLALDPIAPSPVDISLNSVSGQVAIRLPHPADARVEANTATGGVSNAFEDLRVSGQFGAKRITGTLGAGTGTLRATTVSGAIALLRRPAGDTGDTVAPLALDKKVL
ncbi:DUF4097 domain-containing protein [Streptomyces sp. NPDC060334]|uniref:DUF4097 family beta strand repeat-containing protein n=1 Tax=unclassified Streptomyces TaxID=2593676 RepID=UPI0006AD89EC|nr:MULTISPECIES: DUF4097 family beta strand repeat-containing protein [unclassified Streptomyces]KOU66047.1 hypothetical protein ADK55_06285 [Streptomyces sp. WM4235]MCX5073426.1 DUF4097 domain-containing protein [Streptomyces sp. NBC_00424]MCX5155029.1 DUF4097 domain-containing protein [Streptomyces sp. NBC_00291]WUD43314.1 DUF4097 domain-containing protein [Streptomyces sp. NBC_00513]